MPGTHSSLSRSGLMPPRPSRTSTLDVPSQPLSPLARVRNLLLYEEMAGSVRCATRQAQEGCTGAAARQGLAMLR